MQDPVTKAAFVRNNAVAFSAVAPYQINGWNPNVNGQVNTVACGTDGAILLGGQFSSAGGATNRNLAKVDATTGASLGFGLHPGGAVNHMEVVQGHLLVGGNFPGYLTSVSPVTGASDGLALPAISGRYVNPDGTTSGTRIHNMAVNSAGTAVVMSGVFTLVGGLPRQQLFVLDISPYSGATVSAWVAPELSAQCRIPFFARAATWSPDGSRIYTATTGAWPYGTSSYGARTGPCDAVIAFPFTEAPVTHLWINYTGCDSFYSIVADDTTVFAGGHQRWVSNPNGCDYAGPGAIAQQGLAEFDPATGAWQPGPNRGRGWGADDVLRTPAGLWVASDNAFGTGMCAGRQGHAGICFLPN
jgi:hypothetical protein